MLNAALAQQGRRARRSSSTPRRPSSARFASEEHEHHAAPSRDLPGTLQQTTQTLGKVKTLADVLGPAVRGLRPAVRALDAANHAVTPFAKEAAPILRDQIRPFVREARPVVRDLKPAAKNLANGDARPDAHVHGPQPPVQHGRLQPERHARARTVAGRDEGFLFWIAWLDHDGAALFSSSDANGPFRPVTLGAPCSALKQIGDEEPAARDDPRARRFSDPHVCDSEGACS